MKSSKTVLLATAIASFALIGVALYLQLVLNMLPCPWCVVQRYIFIDIGVIALVSAFFPANKMKFGTGLGLLSSLSGVGVAAWHVWIQAHPSVSCGIDPLETSLNTFFTAKLLPTLFFANGECTAEYPPILGMTVPQCALLWFVIFTLVFAWLTFKVKSK
jgi:disulfide bond formation protein DsbB